MLTDRANDTYVARVREEEQADIEGEKEGSRHVLPLWCHSCRLCKEWRSKEGRDGEGTN